MASPYHFVTHSSTEGHPAGSEGQPEVGQLNGQTDRLTDGRNFSLSYRTLFPIGAATRAVRDKMIW